MSRVLRSASVAIAGLYDALGPTDAPPTSAERPAEEAAQDAKPVLATLSRWSLQEKQAGFRARHRTHMLPNGQRAQIGTQWTLLLSQGGTHADEPDQEQDTQHLKESQLH